MRGFLEDCAVVIFGSVIVILFCLLYWTCRLFGIDLNDDF